MERYFNPRSRAKAEENKRKEIELDKLVPLNDVTDPFETDEDDEYQPEKRRKIFTDSKTVSKITKGVKSADHQRNKKSNQTKAIEPKGAFRTAQIKNQNI